VLFFAKNARIAGATESKQPTRATRRVFLAYLRRKSTMDTKSENGRRGGALYALRRKKKKSKNI